MYFFGYGKEFSETKIDSTYFCSISNLILVSFPIAFYSIWMNTKTIFLPQKTKKTYLKSVWGWGSAGRKKKSNLIIQAKTNPNKGLNGGLLMSGQEVVHKLIQLYILVLAQKKGAI